MKCRVLKNGNCEITQGYSSSHNAVDIVGGGYVLDYVVAHSAGKIVFFQDGYANDKGSTGNASYGNCVKIDHGNGYYTLYAHMRKGLSVKNGQTVTKGQQLGYMSDSGNAYGGHLHFEVWKGNTRINPTEYLNKDLPTANTKPNVIYQTHDKTENKYWNEVVNYNTTNAEGYAGYLGHAIDGLKIKLSDGSKIYYQAHLKNGGWLSVVSKSDNTADGYAGVYGKEIDCVAIKADKYTIKYRVHELNGGWLDWVSKMDINDGVNGMAGNYGKAIDAIQIQVI